MDSFCKRLRLARKRKNLNQKELAAMIGVAKSSISEWENGKHRPSTDQIPNICDALNVDPNWLFGDEQSALLREIPTEYYLLENGDTLPAEAKKELDSFIEYLKMKYKGGNKK